MRLKSEFEELMAQLHRKYEDKCKELDVVFQQKKYELDKNYSKVLMNEILADAFRSKCAEPSRCNGMQQGMSFSVSYICVYRGRGGEEGGIGLMTFVTSNGCLYH